MSHKSVLNSNRIFIDTGLSNNITTKLTGGVFTSSNSIFVQDTSNFKNNGVIKIDTEEIYYGSKTSTAFTSLTRAFNNTTKIETEITSGTTVNQTYSAVNENNTTDTKLAGWYTDVLSNQVSLRIGNSDVIQPGIIRYNEDNGVMDGCYLIDPGSNQPHWSSINNIIDFSTNVKALSGVDGTTLSDGQLRAYGDIQYINVKSDQALSLGQVVKTSLNAANLLEVSPCNISITTVGFVSSSSSTNIDIYTLPFDLVSGDKIIFENGGILTLTSSASAGNYRNVSGSLSMDVLAQEIGYLHITANRGDLGNLGIVLSDVTAGTDNKVRILTKGICAIKIKSNSQLNENFSVNNAISSGTPIGLTTDSFGFISPKSKGIVLGHTLHNFTFTTNEYQLINFDPKIDYSL